jgi:hypothetical protein
LHLHQFAKGFVLDRSFLFLSELSFFNSLICHIHEPVEGIFLIVLSALKLIDPFLFGLHHGQQFLKINVFEHFELPCLLFEFFKPLAFAGFVLEKLLLFS